MLLLEDDTGALSAAWDVPPDPDFLACYAPPGQEVSACCAPTVKSFSAYLPGKGESWLRHLRLRGAG